MSKPLYGPLHTESSIRLIRLHAGARRKKLVATLLQADLQTMPSFEAISYTWGHDLGESSFVKLNGVKLRVRDNLYNCLRRIRKKKADRMIWVDALSISQTNLQEKAQQVQMIGKIFAAADRVLIWLGEHADRSKALFRDLNINARRIAEFHAPAPRWKKAFGLEKPIHTDIYGIPLDDDEELKCLHQSLGFRDSDQFVVWEALIQRAYFSRLWVVQEIALAAAIVVHCGDSSAEWEAFTNQFYGFKGALRYASGGSFGGPLGPSGGALNLQHIVETRERGREDTDEKDGTILDLAERFSLFNCQDRHDRIYAVLSIEIQRDGQEAIPVDYTIGIAGVFLAVCERRLETIVYGPAPWAPARDPTHLAIHSLRMHADEMTETVDHFCSKIRTANGDSDWDHLARRFILGLKNTIMEGASWRVYGDLEGEDVLTSLELMKDLLKGLRTRDWLADLMLGWEELQRLWDIVRRAKEPDHIQAARNDVSRHFMTNFLYFGQPEIWEFAERQ